MTSTVSDMEVSQEHGYNLGVSGLDPLPNVSVAIKRA